MGTRELPRPSRSRHSHGSPTRFHVRLRRRTHRRARPASGFGAETQEAFNDAGNPNMFPDQIRDGLMPWTPLKDYARVPREARIDSALGSFGDEGAVGFGKIFDYASGQTYPLRFFNYITGKWMDGMLSTDLTIPEGTYDPLLGGSFTQVARQGLGSQKSQDGGPFVPPPGPANSDYHPFGSRVNAPAGANSIFAGIDISLAGIADLGRGTGQRVPEEGLAEMNGRRTGYASVRSTAPRRDRAPVGRRRQGQPRAHRQGAIELAHRGSEIQRPARAERQTGPVQRRSGRIARPFRAGCSHLRAAAPVGGRGPASTPRVVIPGQRLYLSVRGADEGGLPVVIRRVWIDTPQGEKWTITPQEQTPTSLNANQVQSERFQVQVADRCQAHRSLFRARKPPAERLHDQRSKISRPAFRTLSSFGLDGI